MKDNKRQYGKFYTFVNPFDNVVFRDWFKGILSFEEITILEPFAGANNIVAMLHEIGYKNRWDCFDIEPPLHSDFEEYSVVQRDTLKGFPQGYTVAITNPPYLARNSATRRGLEFPNTKHNDLYKYCLEVMLDNLDYVACIIPESFITQDLFHNRLYAVISLTCKMFKDTDCPVCLALFNPTGTDDFLVYQQEEFLGTYSQLKEYLVESNTNVDWKFNDRTGTVGIKCVDNTKEASIEFVLGETIDPNEIKNTSRAITRVAGLPSSIDLELFIEKCNEKLFTYRTQTKDVFLTPFKGLRRDNTYRRRLDFKTARSILNAVIEEMI